MSARTGIAWTEATWNPVVGCTQISPGCAHCYAKTLHDQRHAAYRAGKLQLLPQYAEPFERVQLMPDRLADPLRWREPTLVFVNSVSDLFHDDIPDEYIARVFGVMMHARRHTFQILTKRPQRMRDWLLVWGRDGGWRCHAEANGWFCDANREGWRTWDRASKVPTPWPLPNVWLGVSVEIQRFASRIVALAQTPAAVRFVSAEPLLGPVDFGGNIADIDWLIAGGESGPKARPCDAAWLRSLRDQCADVGVPFFLKQLGGERDKRAGAQAVLDGLTWTQMPERAA